MIQIEHLDVETKKKYKFKSDGVTIHQRKPILTDVNMTIHQGDFVVITGENGSGKTTLLRTMIGDTSTLRATGNLQFNGLNALRTKDTTAIRRQVGNIFQKYSLIHSKTVEENIIYPLDILGKLTDTNARNKALQRVATQLGILDKLDEFPHQLSGGEAQRVVIARSLILEPDVFLVDEPTSNLDKSISRGIMEVFEALHQEGKTIIMITHHKELLKKRGKRLFRVENGRVHEVGDTDD